MKKLNPWLVLTICLSLLLLVQYFTVIRPAKVFDEKCKLACKDDKQYTVAYQPVQSTFDGDLLCVCYYPSLEGNTIEVKNLE